MSNSRKGRAAAKAAAPHTNKVPHHGISGRRPLTITIHNVKAASFSMYDGTILR